MTDTKIKPLNQPGDYYFCSLCAAWHRFTNDPSSAGNQHLSHLDENETNSPVSKYFFCSLCMKWHTYARKDHLQYRLHIQRDPNMITAPIVQPPHAPSSSNSHHSPTAVIGSFDGAAGLWKTEFELRKNNTIGYREKWLHSLLIEKMQDGNIPGLDLEFLYYETPVGKVKRNKQFGREHIDILTKETHTKALVVVEVKKQGEDMGSAVSQGLSYIEWLFKYRELLKPRIQQLGWDVDMDKLKLVLLAPDTKFKNAGLDMTILEQVKRLNCEVMASYIDPGWIKDENISIKGINPF